MSSGDPDIDKKIGKETRFSKDNQPKNRGRKPTKWKQLTKAYDINATDRENLAKMIIACKTKDDIFKLMKDKKIPFGVWAACVAVMADAKKGGTGFLKYLMDAAFGKIPDKTEHSGKIDYTDMTKEDRVLRIKELEALAEQRRKENEEKDDG